MTPSVFLCAASLSGLVKLIVEGKARRPAIPLLTLGIFLFLLIAFSVSSITSASHRINAYLPSYSRLFSYHKSKNKF
jgi:hypothetical protein